MNTEIGEALWRDKYGGWSTVFTREQLESVIDRVLIEAEEVGIIYPEKEDLEDRVEQLEDEINTLQRTLTYLEVVSPHLVKEAREYGISLETEPTGLAVVVPIGIQNLRP